MPLRLWNRKKPEPKEMTRITHNSVFAAHRLMPDGDFKIDIRHFPIRLSGCRFIQGTEQLASSPRQRLRRLCGASSSERSAPKTHQTFAISSRYRVMLISE